MWAAFQADKPLCLNSVWTWAKLSFSAQMQDCGLDLSAFDCNSSSIKKKQTLLKNPFISAVQNKSVIETVPSA